MTAKIMTVVGARPQFIKAAVVSHALSEYEGVKEEIVHTGQHYDANMSQTFFDELDIPEPKVNLGVSGGTHGQMTARMLEALETQMIESNPAVVLLYGDTNSTLAAALAAAKLHIPIVHVEAGTRTHSATNPEEINRICTDHVATKLLCCTQENFDNLKLENLADRAEFVGDPMYDAFLRYSEVAKKPRLTGILGEGASLELPEEFYYVTCHREENTGVDETMSGLLDALSSLDSPVVYPVHPRNRSMVKRLAAKDSLSNILFVEPVGYLESVYLVNHAKQVITDSGGLQREAFFAGVKCTTILDFKVWPETMVDGRNLLARPTRESIRTAMEKPQTIDRDYQPFGDGNAAKRIADSVVGLAKGCSR
ncbi:non-hydrolyzing UDP-N-acetylglucosamine 2-epimerase [Adlercreutzia sp. ZJ138]|uniref:non-hydrolyzing UDP-N-acetylglucosamine 2-epimerase n=1 Tax=Adlercreutzia sp. ZJ138 TaxID=2709405 RepID=UPI001F1498AF|nr:UDP-N-acetylglucosamine 2-epimerase (non-hydrolyzing) [Adlercreutzia sp. ZJ138]